MRKRKVDEILGQREMHEGDEGGIEIYIYSSGHPTFPWAARIGGRSCYRKTLHAAVSSALEALAKSDRADGNA